ncbi:Hsp20/alpha crystallin family protein [Burkholderia sp. M6-3]
MSNLTRFDPLSLDPVSEMFQGFFRPMRSMLTTQDNELASMKIDVTENDGAYSVKAELPGVDKKDIDVQIDGRIVSINAKVERNKEEKEGERVVRRERYAGTFSRSFALGGEVDEGNSKAEYKDGVLSLSLPKKTSGDHKRLTVN